MARATTVAETQDDQTNHQTITQFVAQTSAAEQACSAGDAHLMSRWAIHQVAGRPVPRLVWRIAGISLTAAGA